MIAISGNRPWIGKGLRGSNGNAAHRRSRRIRPGFTLAETLIVLVVLGTLFAMGVPKLNRTTRHRRVMAAASALNADIPVAFSLAARQRKPVVVSYHAASGEIRVTDRATGTVYRRRALRTTSEYRLDSVTMTPASVQLFPTGVGSTAFTVRLVNGSYKRQIAVSRTGFTRVTNQ